MWENGSNKHVFFSESPEETLEIGKRLAERYPGPQIFCFSGELGTGKTTLIKGLISTLTDLCDTEISSPTFSTLHVYEGKVVACHFDLYRINDEEEFSFLGFDEYLDGSYPVAIEWAERILSLLPENAIHIYLSHAGPEKRKIEVIE